MSGQQPPDAADEQEDAFWMRPADDDPSGTELTPPMGDWSPPSTTEWERRPTNPEPGAPSEPGYPAADEFLPPTQNHPQGPQPAFSIPRQSGAVRGCLIILLVVVAVLVLGAGCLAWAISQLPDTPIPTVSDSGVEHTVEYRVTTSEPAQVYYSAGARTASVSTEGGTTLTLSATGREVVYVSVTVSSEQVVGCEILVDGVSVDSVTDTGLASCTGVTE